MSEMGLSCEHMHSTKVATNGLPFYLSEMGLEPTQISPYAPETYVSTIPPLRLNLTINYFIFLKNSSEINCEYLFFSLTETSNLCSPPLVCATETIPPTSPIGNFLTLASNFT